MKFAKYDNWLNERFEEESDPIEDMSIGYKIKIIQWLRQMYITSYKLTDDLKINLYDDTNLKGNGLTEFPEYIDFNICIGDFSVAWNELTTLRGCPKEIWGYFNCSGNRLTSLEGAPKEVHKRRKSSGNFYCGGQKNGTKFTVEQVKEICKVDESIFV